MHSYHVQVTLTARQIADLISCAIDGGSTYWCKGLYPVRIVEGPYHDGVLGEGTWWEADSRVWENDFSVRVFDRADDAVYTIGPADLQKALDVLTKQYANHIADILDDNMDADTGDAFLQCVVFGDIIYG